MDKAERDKLAQIVADLRFGADANEFSTRVADRLTGAFPDLAQDVEEYSAIHLFDRFMPILRDAYQVKHTGDIDFGRKKTLQRRVRRYDEELNDAERRNTVLDVFTTYIEQSGQTPAALLPRLDTIIGSDRWEHAKRTAAEQYGYDLAWMP